MAAKRIPELPTLTGAGSVAGDSLLIYDADLDATKRITRAELAIGLQADLPVAPTVGTLGGQEADAVAITGGTITGVALSGLTAPLAVADGGTGAADASGARGNLGTAAAGANADITSLSGLTTPLSIAQGGTNAATAGAARTALGAAAAGANSDIISLAGLTTALSIAQGGTGATTAAAALTALGALGIVASDLSATGYIKLSNGLHLMWGSATAATNNAATAVSFMAEITLTTFSRVVLSGGVFSNEDRNGPYVASCSTSGFVMGNNKPEPVTVFWIGVGI